MQKHEACQFRWLGYFFNGINVELAFTGASVSAANGEIMVIWQELPHKYCAMQHSALRINQVARACFAAVAR